MIRFSRQEGSGGSRVLFFYPVWGRGERDVISGRTVCLCC